MSRSSFPTSTSLKLASHEGMGDGAKVPGNSFPAAGATTDSAALDPGNTSSVNAAQFSAAIRAFETLSNTPAIATNATSPILTLLDAFAQNATAVGTTASVTA